MQAADAPTPKMAVAINFPKDIRTWEVEYQVGNRTGLIMEWVLKGQTIEAWKEMVANQIAFGDTTLADYVANWKTVTKKSASDLRLTETEGKDGSITIVYDSAKFNEIGIRRFMKGSDGIYIIAYHVRPTEKKEVTYKLWADIVEKSELVPNSVLSK